MCSRRVVFHEKDKEHPNKQQNKKNTTHPKNMDKDTLIESDVPLGKNQEYSQQNNHETSAPAYTYSGNVNEHVYVTVDNDIEHVSRGTLDESVWETVRRDLEIIHQRLRLIIYPQFIQSSSMFVDNTNFSSLEAQDQHNSVAGANNESDLWAPLLFILLFSKIASSSNTSFSLYFLASWIIILMGSVHLKKFSMLRSSETNNFNNADSNGSSSSSQGIQSSKKILLNVSLLGYCIFPILLNSILIKLILNPFIIKYYLHISFIEKLIKLVLIGVTTFWSYHCCISSVTGNTVNTNNTNNENDTNNIDIIHKLPILILFGFLNWFNMV